ncbi:MAG TPA: MotA/TolQ/ExbB proton channel family protein [Candidatus Hydrogenedentes bacterium]|nr:MotA/TolQ/ExbB proton channel family protein [Candidatus Hydrogenedentota bacterium]
MAALAICSLMGATVIIERAVALRRRAVIDPKLVATIEVYNGDTSTQRLLDLCNRSPTSLAHVVKEVLDARHLDVPHLREVMNAAGRVEVGRLKRGLTLLEIIAGVSPLIGLLGTVLGMFTVFNAITAHGIGDAQVLSGGISKALITTIAGLCIGIPALAFHSWFSKRVEDLASEIQGHATRLILKLGGTDAAGVVGEQEES